MRALVALILLVVSAGVPAASAASHEESSTQRRVAALAAQIRCPVCQNLSVEDSPPTRARSGPVRFEPHWKGWSYMLSAARL